MKEIKRATSKWEQAAKNFELRTLELQREKNDNFKKQEKEMEETLKRESKALKDEMLKKIICLFCRFSLTRYGHVVVQKTFFSMPSLIFMRKALHRYVNPNRSRGKLQCHLVVGSKVMSDHFF